jgi:hypothetical protein
MPISFQPKTAILTPVSIPNLEATGLIYEAIAADLVLGFSIGDKIEVRTVDISDGAGGAITTTQYYNINTKSVISETLFATEAAIVANFRLLGGSVVSLAKPLPLLSIEVQTPTIFGVDQIFSVADLLTIKGLSMPAGATWIDVELQLRPDTQSDYFLYTTGSTLPTMTPKQIGQSKQEVSLKNEGQIADAKFLAVTAVAGTAVMVLEFWSSNPN